MGELAKACADPNMGFFSVWAKGVWARSTKRPLPRLPAAFEKNTKWKLGDLDFLFRPEWRTNYPSTVLPARQVLLQFEGEEKMVFMMRTTLGEALAKYCDTLSLAALGAIEKMVTPTGFE